MRLKNVSFELQNGEMAFLPAILALAKAPYLN
jgi:hypothetical protein